MLHLDKKRGTKRDQVRDIMDHGRQVRVTERVLDVQVPFEGDKTMFDYRPSSSKILHEPVEVERGHLKYTMPFDPSQQERFNVLLDQIEYNLNMIRRDEEAFSQEAIERLKRTIEDRRRRMQDETETAKKFDFPVN